ncbi:imidazole glycerol phosphate synthase subunit HisH [bacterium]|nr:imidazole glycerol phosphate synthase subunit HisH [bacterium]
MTVTILDYGVGNLGSVRNALKFLGIEPVITADRDVIAATTVLVVPGQGAAGDAMAALRSQSLVPVVQDYIRSGRPYLGICLGFQLLFDVTEEDGGTQGLGIFGGQVKRFDSAVVKVPQMGWNQLDVVNDPLNLTVGLDQPLNGYFANSYYALPDDPSIVFTTTEYGVRFASSIQTSTVLGCQFHPEKSGPVGLHIMKEFLNRHAYSY